MDERLRFVARQFEPIARGGREIVQTTGCTSNNFSSTTSDQELATPQRHSLALEQAAHKTDPQSRCTAPRYLSNQSSVSRTLSLYGMSPWPPS
jgi:hypothetical protein